jgi:hypothetical protein
MTEYNASTLEEQVDDLCDFIANEDTGTEKKVRISLIALGVIGLLLVGSFAYSNAQLREITEPETLAKHLFVSLDSQKSAFANQLKKVLVDTTPELARFIRKSVIEEGVPYLATKSEALLSAYMDELIVMTRGHLETAFHEVVQENQDTIRAAVRQEERSSDWPSNALRPMREKLHAQLIATTDAGKPTEANNAIQKSLIALKNLNQRLKKLAGKKQSKMTRQERLGSRLINVFWQYTQSRKPSEVDSKQAAGSGKYANEGNPDPNKVE